jgi:hypothetical protein
MPKKAPNPAKNASMTRATAAKNGRRRQKKPRVTLRCTANIYAGPNERIIEFAFPGAVTRTGGLIAFRHLPDGEFLVDITALDAGVAVRVLGKGVSR